MGSEGGSSCRRIEYPRWRWSAVSVTLLLLLQQQQQHQGVESFQTAVLPVRPLRTTTAANTPTTTVQRQVLFLPTKRSDSRSSSSTALKFMGSEGGLLGVGGPEIFTILLVGYFVLGPSDLYKLVKEIGKFIQNIRTLGTDLSTTFENNMESTLQLDELRKAQRELNDAFSFRRSINVDAESEAFSVEAGSAQEAEAAAAAAGTAAVAGMSADPNAKPKKIRRRVRRKVTEEEADVMASPVVNNVPDLEMPETAFAADSTTTSTGGISAAEAAEIEAEFDKYVLNPSSPSASFSGLDDWYGEPKAGAMDKSAASAAPAMDQAAQSRFQQQMSGNWNDQILAAGDKLEPMSLVMNKIALLEQEKSAALRRLEEEFAKRTELEEKYYQEQRKLLEEAATEVQNAAFGVDSKSVI